MLIAKNIKYGEGIEENILKNLPTRLGIPNEDVKNINVVNDVTEYLEQHIGYTITSFELAEGFCYDFGYFFNRKDSGSCRIELPVRLEDIDDIDECIKIALQNNVLNEEYADNIIYVEELNANEAREMGFWT